ncbi:MAG: hydrogenase iron-sulfur subunit [Syntrophorhabdales bacterium]|jgi:coenzyme F420-reducing hydrogenase delta subunit
MQANHHFASVTIFFCRQLDPDQDKNRRPLEKELGRNIRFFPLPCSGRIDVLHLLKALEAGSDKVYLITCPEGACKYGQGNVRAGKRLDYARGLIEEINLPAARLELIRAPGPLPLSIDAFVRRLLDMDQAGSPAGREGKAEPFAVR